MILILSSYSFWFHVRTPYQSLMMIRWSIRYVQPGSVFLRLQCCPSFFSDAFIAPLSSTHCLQSVDEAGETLDESDSPNPLSFTAAVRRPQKLDMCWEFEDDLTDPDDDVEGKIPIKVGRCRPFPLNQVMLLDVTGLVSKSYFDSKSHPTIHHYLQNQSNWRSLDKGSMKMKQFEPHIRAPNDLNFSSKHLPLKEERDTSLLLHAINHVLKKHANKPSNTRHSINIYDASTPTSFLKTVKEQQQLPHIDYKHSELNHFKGQSPNHVRPWSMEMPLSSGGFFLCIYGSVDDYTIWLNDDGHAQFANPPICVFVPQGCVLLWR